MVQCNIGQGDAKLRHKAGARAAAGIDCTFCLVFGPASNLKPVLRSILDRGKGDLKKNVRQPTGRANRQFPGGFRGS
jgi:hypothetical protein